MSESKCDVQAEDGAREVARVVEALPPEKETARVQKHHRIQTL